jgi:hypothetical protein
MKTISRILAAVLMLGFIVALTQNVNAQTYAAQSMTVPSVLAIGTTNLASPPVLDVRKQSNVAVAFTINPTSAGGTNTYVFHRSLDGTYYDDITTISVVVASTSATQKSVVTNLSCAGIGYLKLYSIQAGGAVTNTAAKYGIKISAP